MVIDPEIAVVKDPSSGCSNEVSGGPILVVFPGWQPVQRTWPDEPKVVVDGLPAKKPPVVVVVKFISPSSWTWHPDSKIVTRAAGKNERTMR